MNEEKRKNGRGKGGAGLKEKKKTFRSHLRADKVVGGVRDRRPPEQQARRGCDVDVNVKESKRGKELKDHHGGGKSRRSGGKVRRATIRRVHQKKFTLQGDRRHNEGGPGTSRRMRT